MEHIMFAYVLHQLASFFERSEQRRRDAYLASSSDLGDLERRMRTIDSNGRPF
jgi:hypothetical protein